MVSVLKSKGEAAGKFQGAAVKQAAAFGFDCERQFVCDFAKPQRGGRWVATLIGDDRAWQPVVPWRGR